MLTLALATLLQVELLGDDDLDVREHATAAVRRAGLEAGPALMRALESADAEVRARAEMLLDELAAHLPATAIRVWIDFVEGRAFFCVRNTSPVRVVVRRMKIVDGRNSAWTYTHCFAATVLALRPHETRRLALPHLVPVETERGGIEIRPVCAWAAGETKGTLARLRVAVGPGATELVFELKNNDAVAMARILAQVFEGDLKWPSPFFRPDARTNSVVVGGVDAETLVIVEDLIEQLDRNPTEPSPEP